MPLIDLRIRSLLLAGTLTATLGAVGASIHHQLVPINLGFEVRDGLNGPRGWGVGGGGYDVGLDSVSPMAGRFSLRTRWIGPGVRGAQSFGVATTTYPQTLARGRALRLSGYIRTEDITSGYAGFWVRVDGGARSIAFDNMAQRGARGTTPWTKYEIELPVDSGASGIVLGQ